MSKFKPQLPKLSNLLEHSKHPKFLKLPRSNSTPKPSGWRRAIRIALVLAALAAIYTLYLQKTPAVEPLTKNQQTVFLSTVPVVSETNRLIIPKIGVDSEIFSGNADVLNKGTWHRFPDRGDPNSGGNFILAAHRYVSQWTPQRTVKQSVLYNINEMSVGDSILIDWKGKRTGYIVTEIKSVKPNDSSIELITSTPQLTLYTCTLKGVNDGREVVIAKKLN
jgi:sortase A